jgi:hypothetical protein
MYKMELLRPVFSPICQFRITRTALSDDAGLLVDLQSLLNPAVRVGEK